MLGIEQTELKTCGLEESKRREKTLKISGTAGDLSVKPRAEIGDNVTVKARTCIR